MVLGALLAAALVGLLARASAPATEAAAIHCRYAQMLVEVEPMPTPAGRPVVDVADFKTLARLAERQGWPSATSCWCCTGRAATWRRSLSRTTPGRTGTALARASPTLPGRLPSRPCDPQKDRYKTADQNGRGG
jgi:hypothetical protein